MPYKNKEAHDAAKDKRNARRRAHKSQVGNGEAFRIGMRRNLHIINDNETREFRRSSIDGMKQAQEERIRKAHAAMMQERSNRAKPAEASEAEQKNSIQGRGL